LQNSWKQEETVIPGKQSATRNPGFPSNSGFRRPPGLDPGFAGMAEQVTFAGGSREKHLGPMIHYRFALTHRLFCKISIAPARLFQLEIIPKFFESQFHGGDSLEDVRLVDVSHVGQAENLSLGLVLTPAMVRLCFSRRILTTFCPSIPGGATTAVTASE